MVINNSNIDAALVAGPTSATKLGTAAASDPRPAGRRIDDHAQVSDLAAQLSGDSSRLSRLQASIDAGTYQVSPQALAGSLIRNALIT